MAHRGCPARLFGVFAFFCLMFSNAAFAKNNPSYTQLGHDISIGPNDQVGDVTCVACSIRIRGQVAGDATAVGGSIVLEDQAQVAGDVTAVAGDARLDQEVKVAGDVTVVGGELRRDPKASISGDVTSVGGRVWVVPILLVPFVILGLLVALIIWIAQRMRRPSLPPVPA
jgi:hypothetical protein